MEKQQQRLALNKKTVSVLHAKEMMDFRSVISLTTWQPSITIMPTTVPVTFTVVSTVVYP